ncbi:nucleoside triphosphate pyrophosphohydrolase [Tersicoccus sp. MR15.9]|uniref:nucleoside triphosphate pyrophosphohydrolase n=1 Tax=Tersicoccus mangrovi TaxID=3121635 RepID=UPI002FE5E59E
MGKLIRDRIPEITTAAGGICGTRVLDDDEYAYQLRAKVIEEATEVAGALGRDHLIEEVGDVLEVVDALLAHEGITMAEVRAAAHAKRQARGGFAGRLFTTDYVAPKEIR